MGAPKRYPPPHVQLAELAREARGRGETFESFWYRAVRPERSQRMVMVTTGEPPPGCVLWPTDPKDRKEWRHAILTSRDAWCRAYYRLPQEPAERAVKILGELLDELGGLTLADIAAA